MLDEAHSLLRSNARYFNDVSSNSRLLVTVLIYITLFSFPLIQNSVLLLNTLTATGIPDFMQLSSSVEKPAVFRQ